jgi:hypothetical protein
MILLGHERQCFSRTNKRFRTTPTACIRFAVQSRIEILHILLEHSYDSQRNEDAYSARRLHRRQPVARSQDSWCFVSGFGDGWVRPPIARRDHVDSVVEVVDSFARSTAGWCSSGIAAVGYIAALRQTMPPRLRSLCTWRWDRR